MPLADNLHLFFIRQPSKGKLFVPWYSIRSRVQSESTKWEKFALRVFVPVCRKTSFKASTNWPKASKCGNAGHFRRAACSGFPFVKTVYNKPSFPSFLISSSNFHQFRLHKPLHNTNSHQTIRPSQPWPPQFTSKSFAFAISQPEASLSFPHKHRSSGTSKEFLLNLVRIRL